MTSNDTCFSFYIIKLQIVVSKKPIIVFRACNLSIHVLIHVLSNNVHLIKSYLVAPEVIIGESK